MGQKEKSRWDDGSGGSAALTETVLSYRQVRAWWRETKGQQESNVKTPNEGVHPTRGHAKNGREPHGDVDMHRMSQTSLLLLTVQPRSQLGYIPVSHLYLPEMCVCLLCPLMLYKVHSETPKTLLKHICRHHPGGAMLQYCIVIGY